MVAEKKRMEAPSESRGISKQKWLEERKKKIGKLLDANGLDLQKAYMLDTQEAAEAKYKKWEKDPAPFGWDGMLRTATYSIFLFFHYLGYFIICFMVHSVTPFCCSNFHVLPSIYTYIYPTSNIIGP